ncbi:MAG TPA: branched-chain amino acid ABC transporter permease [Gammaproteobacteria bacterium]|nr:branched-chain amino acid ABC transporter permease [Gammaproteobacteria bacterium]
MSTQSLQSTRGRVLAGAWPWIAMGAAFLVAPWIFHSNSAISVLSLTGIAIVFALSYNMLFGATGLLSFGHAVYYGLGAYFTMHALNYFGATGVPFPVGLLPLIGGATGLVFGLVLGYISTRRAGITFAMISLGIGVLMASLAVILRHFFGGDGGLSGDPTKGAHWFGVPFSQPIQLYYFVAIWSLICIAAMYFLTMTPLGHIANAVRDNPERAQFIGYNTHQVRFRVHTLAGLFAGVAGGMAAIVNGIVTPGALGLTNSGEVLMMAYIGGAGIFFGPIAGAIIITFMEVLLSNYTDAWQLYIGLFFVLVVMYVPGGVASLIQMHLPVLRRRLFKHLLLPYAMMIPPGAVFVLGLVFLVQMAYHLHGVMIFLNQPFTFMGVQFPAHSAWTWLGALAITGAALWLCTLVGRRVARAWDEIAESMAPGQPSGGQQ